MEAVQCLGNCGFIVRGAVSDGGLKLKAFTKDFVIHDDDCHICSMFVEPTGSDLLCLCRKLEGNSSLLIPNRNRKVLLISPDDDANSELCLSVRDNGDWILRAYGQLVDTKKTHLKVHVRK